MSGHLAEHRDSFLTQVSDPSRSREASIATRGCRCPMRFGGSAPQQSDLQMRTMQRHPVRHRPPRRALGAIGRPAAMGFALFAAAGLGCSKPRQGPGISADLVGEANGKRAEAEWLLELGTGPEQTARVCARGAQDRIAEALCAQPNPQIDGIDALYRVLGLASPEERLVAATTHSTSLSAPSVTAANPRVFVFVNNIQYVPMPFQKIGALAFTRGEQFVEMVALDTKTYDYNFYLLAFEQSCNTSSCTPEQLLTEAIEHDWTGWTLYSDADLADTPLDCASCHLPYGSGTHKLLLMRQLADPWIHWGDFRGVNEGADCSQDGPTVNPGRHIPGEGLDVLTKLEGPDGRYAGIAVAELNASKSGRLFSDFMVDARLRINDSPYGSNYPQSELELDSARILCERLKQGTNITWEQYRADLTSRGLPVAHHQSDVLDAEKRRELITDRASVLARHAEDDAFDVAASWMDEDVAADVGLLPRESDGGRQILTQMCVRCHSNSAPPGSKRARFNAERLTRIEPSTAQAIRHRIRLAATSPKLMPPRRAGRLTSDAIERVEDYLEAHCSDPSAGACE
jgi:mono/diheme cytochrome c family protein